MSPQFRKTLEGGGLSVHLAIWKVSSFFIPIVLQSNQGCRRLLPVEKARTSVSARQAIDLLPTSQTGGGGGIPLLGREPSAHYSQGSGQLPPWAYLMSFAAGHG